MKSDAGALERPAAAEQAAPASRRLASFEIHLRRRFAVAYFVLSIAVGAAVGLFIVFAGRSGPEPAGRWSANQPTLHGTAAADQIARYVAGRYRLASGNQLVTVLAGPAQVQDVRISRVAIRPGFADDRQEDVRLFDTGSSILYILCGLGQQCAIPEGKPSQERAMLLRREGLELALHTFKYVGDVDSVLAFIPPPPGDQPSVTLYFRRDELGPHLEVPLGRTLPEREQLTPAGLGEAETARVRGLTLSDFRTGRFSGIYQFEFQQIPDGTAILVLAPLAS